MRYRWVPLFVVMHIARLSGASGQSLEQQRCFAPGPGDDTIGGCTALIQLGRETPENLAKAFSSRGFAYALKDQHNRAIEDFEQAIRLNPNYAEAFNNRGLAYLLKDQYDRAIEDYDQAIRLNPNYALAFVSRGGAYSVKGQYDRAIEDFDQAIRLNPNYALAFNSRGHAHFSKGLAACRPASLPPCALAIAQYDRAIGDFDQAILINPNDAMAAWAYGERSLVKSAKGDSAGAAADLAKGQQLSSTVGK